MLKPALDPRWHGRLALGLLLAPALLWLGALIILPHVDLAVLSFGERVGPRQYAASLAQYKTFFAEPLYWHVFLRTAVMSVIATFLTLLLAFPIAWIIAKLARGRAGSLLFIICLIPFWVSETVRTLGWMILLRESGVLPALLVKLGLTAMPVELLYRDATILVGLVYTSLLFMVVPLVSSLESLDNSLIEAAYDLGAGGFSILRSIVIPHAAPGITAGCIVVFMLTLGNYLTPTLLGSIGTSGLVAICVTGLSALVGTTNAFLIERGRFRGKQVLSILMLAPLVIPGVILGISILAFASRLADFADETFGLELDFLRPGLPLVVLGQFSYIATIATLTISARLRRFDRTLEEAALNLGASKAAVFRTILLPYLRPALLGSAAISFLMSFADFNTTLMLVGADTPLTVMMYGRMREGATPVLNAVSLFLMIASAVLALPLLRRGGPRAKPAS